MDITITGRGVGIPERFEDYASEKADKVAALVEKLLERIRQAKDRRKVHRGARRPTSLHDATRSGKVVDLVPAGADVIERVATGEIPVAAPEAEPEWSPVVIRHKVFPTVRMTPEDAVDHMELVGHDFYLFVDAGTDRPSVVYRRKGWDYGVIALENPVDDREPRPQRKRSRGSTAAPARTDVSAAG